MLSLKVHEKTLGSQNYAYVFVTNEMNFKICIDIDFRILSLKFA